MTYYSKIALIAALIVASMVANAVWTLQDADARRPRPKYELRLGWHAPDWRAWAKCSTTVVVAVGADGETVLGITPGEKECPDSFYVSKRRGLRG